MKHEWRKQEKELYGVQKKPIILTVPKLNFIMIKGKGNPNNEDFSDRVGALMSIAYPIKMSFKQYLKANPRKERDYPYNDYTVYPLEGVWTSEDRDSTNKEAYTYTIMIRQPHFITEEMFSDALKKAKGKKHNPLLSEVTLGQEKEELVAQILHLGSYDLERASFDKIDDFIQEEGYVRKGHEHREIYLSDSRKIAPEKLKTILRYSVEKN